MGRIEAGPRVVHQATPGPKQGLSDAPRGFGAAERSGQTRIPPTWQMLCAASMHSDVGEAQLLHDELQEGDPLSTRLGDDDPEVGQSDREGDARKTGSRSQIHGIPACLGEDGRGSEGIQDVPLPEAGDIALRHQPEGGASVTDVPFVRGQAIRLVRVERDPEQSRGGGQTLMFHVKHRSSPNARGVGGTILSGAG